MASESDMMPAVFRYRGRQWQMLMMSLYHIFGRGIFHRVSDYLHYSPSDCRLPCTYITLTCTRGSPRGYGTYLL